MPLKTDVVNVPQVWLKRVPECSVCFLHLCLTCAFSKKPISMSVNYVVLVLWCRSAAPSKTSTRNFLKSFLQRFTGLPAYIQLCVSTDFVRSGFCLVLKWMITTCYCSNVLMWARGEHTVTRRSVQSVTCRDRGWSCLNILIPRQVFRVPGQCWARKEDIPERGSFIFIPFSDPGWPIRPQRSAGDWPDLGHSSGIQWKKALSSLVGQSPDPGWSAGWVERLVSGPLIPQNWACQSCKWIILLKCKGGKSLAAYFYLFIIRMI